MTVCRSVILLTSLAILFCAASPALRAQPPVQSGYELDWSDDFNGPTLDLASWIPVFSVEPTNNSLHAYLPENNIVANGRLNIWSTNVPFGQFAYRSGQVLSASLHRYGRFEVRADLPTSRGMWPAIWLLPDQPPLWPSQGEIDIMENRGNEPTITSSAFHWGTNPPFVHQFVFSENRMSINGTPVNFHDSFHTYAVEWDPSQIRYYVDGVHFYTVRDNQVANFLMTSQTEPMRLVINTAIGGDFLPDPDASTQWPQVFSIDHVYVYDRTGDPLLTLENGNFDLDGGGLSGWSLFGSNGMNVSLNQQQSLSGNSSLKLFGQFNGAQNFSGVEQGISVQPGDQIQVVAQARVNSSDSLAGTGNQAFLKFDFYNTLYGAFGSSQYISSQQVLIADGSSPVNQWREHVLTTVAPSNAVEARVAIVFRQVNNGGGAVFVDDVEFTNQSAESTVNASSLTIDTGIIREGGLAETVSSDDQHLVVSSAPPQFPDFRPLQMTLNAVSPFSGPSALELRLEASANSVGLHGNIEAFNYLTNEFELVGTFPSLLADNVINLELEGNVQRFVQGNTNQMAVRLSWMANRPVPMFPWQVQIDEMAWTASR